MFSTIKNKLGAFGWHEWLAVAWCVLFSSVGLLAGCGITDRLIAQTKPTAGNGAGGSKGAGTAGAACDGGWWAQVAGLGVLNWMGGLLILLGGAAFVGTFIPAVGAFFPRKMAVSCVAAGVASIFLYNLLTEYAWVVYITLAIGGVVLLLTYWPSVKGMAVKVWELVSRKDEDGDGKIGPNE